MELKQLEYDFIVCKLDSIASIDFSQEIVFVAKTDDEISLVCTADNKPDNVIAIEENWQALKICGMLDFSLVGIIAKIASLLAQQNISIFVISTYNTDFILIKNHHYNKAITVLRENDYTII